MCVCVFGLFFLQRQTEFGFASGRWDLRPFRDDGDYEVRLHAGELGVGCGCRWVGGGSAAGLAGGDVR